MNTILQQFHDYLSLSYNPTPILQRYKIITFSYMYAQSTYIQFHRTICSRYAKVLYHL